LTVTLISSKEQMLCGRAWYGDEFIREWLH